MPPVGPARGRRLTAVPPRTSPTTAALQIDVDGSSVTLPSAGGFDAAWYVLEPR